MLVELNYKIIDWAQVCHCLKQLGNVDNLKLVDRKSKSLLEQGGKESEADVYRLTIDQFVNAAGLIVVAINDRHNSLLVFIILLLLDKVHLF